MDVDNPKTRGRDFTALDAAHLRLTDLVHAADQRYEQGIALTHLQLLNLQEACKAALALSKPFRSRSRPAGDARAERLVS